MDGVIGAFSGAGAPANVTTDTGLLRVTFSSDATLQRPGWAANYTAAAAVQAPLPACAPGELTVQAALRTRAGAEEASWTVVQRAAAASVFTDPLGALAGGLAAAITGGSAVVMAGGLLPPAVALSVPTAVKQASATRGDYKDYRSYYAYECLPPGSYTLNMYDSYGDGWAGGRLALRAMQRDGGGAGAARGACQVAEGTVAAGSAEVAFAIQVRIRLRLRATPRIPPPPLAGLCAARPPAAGPAAPRALLRVDRIAHKRPACVNVCPPPLQANTSGAACAGLPDKGFFVEAQLAVAGETPATLTLAKRKSLKDALAILLEVDSSQVGLGGRIVQLIIVQSMVLGWPWLGLVAAPECAGWGSRKTSSGAAPARLQPRARLPSISVVVVWWG